MQTQTTSAEKFGSHILFGIITALVVINLSFVLGFTISNWTLPLSYLLYIAGLYVIKRKRKEHISKFDVVLVFLLPLYFSIATFYIGKSYDSSFDGQDYHSGAVIALSNGWNPWLASELPFKLPDANAYVLGYPKSLWFLQTGIYEITNKLNSAVVTNFIIMIVSLLFVYGALKRIKLSAFWSIVLTFVILLEMNYIQQFFTFMADGFSYQLALIAISSLVMLVTDKKKLLPLAVFFSAWILLAGIKFSNLPLFIILGGVIFAYLVLNVYKKPSLLWVTGVFLIIGCLLLWVPYGKNYLEHGSPIYPSNTAFAQNDLREQNIPSNIKNENNLGLLYYGIFSEMQREGTPESPQNIARIKIPFSTSLQELSITNNYGGRVGSEGALFSGLVVSSLVLYLFMLLFYRFVFSNIKPVLFLNGAIVLILAAALLNPNPNVLRLVPLIYFLPIAILITLVASKMYSHSKFIQILCAIFVLLFIANIFLKLVPTVKARNHEFAAQNHLLKTMKESNKTYEVRTDYFYSSYVVLKEKEVKFRIPAKLSCKNPKAMNTMFRTYYCP